MLKICKSDNDHILKINKKAKTNKKKADKNSGFMLTL